MGLIDFILNLAGLLMWIKWRSTLFDPLNKRTPATLIGTLRRAAPGEKGALYAAYRVARPRRDLARDGC